MNLLSRRIPTIVGMALVVAIVVGLFYYFQKKNTQVSGENIPTKVRITNLGDNKFSVSWVTNSEIEGAIEYAPVGEKLSQKARDDRDGGGAGKYLTHHVTIDELQPSTQYAFRILSGENASRFDNNGSPYIATTGPVIGKTPPSHNLYGNVILPTKQNATGAIVYLTIPGGGVASTLVHESGNYAITLSTIRSSDGRAYVNYDPSATIVGVVVEAGKTQASSSITLANSTPVPTITLGQNIDFLTPGETPTVAEIIPEKPAIYNVEPLSGSQINAVTTATVTLLNPKEIGETLYTLRPEFRGTGPVGLTLSIALKGQKAISDTATIGSDGTWSWAPVIDLKTGKQTVTVSYLGSAGTTQKIEREFTVAASTTGLDPAFVSSPSGSTKASATPVPSPSSRSVIPATESGVPVTGVIENTLLTGALGVVIIIVGAVLFAL